MPSRELPSSQTSPSSACFEKCSTRVQPLPQSTSVIGDSLREAPDGVHSAASDSAGCAAKRMPCCVSAAPVAMAAVPPATIGHKCIRREAKRNMLEALQNLCPSEDDARAADGLLPFSKKGGCFVATHPAQS